MTRSEALVLLIWCVPLAAKLKSHGLAIELTQEDQITIKGFNRVLESGWLNSPTIYHLAGLNRSDIELLTAKVLRQQAKAPATTTAATQQEAELKPGQSSYSQQSPQHYRSNAEDKGATLQAPAHFGESKVEILEVLELTEAKEHLKAEQFKQALEKLYRLAANYPDDREIQELIILCLRAQREPTKITLEVAPARLEVKFTSYSKWISLLVAARYKINGNYSKPSQIPLFPGVGRWEKRQEYRRFEV